MTRTIIVTVEGEQTSVETRGFQGGDCLKATLALERALGLKTSDQKTAEYARTTTRAQAREEAT